MAKMTDQDKDENTSAAIRKRHDATNDAATKHHKQRIEEELRKAGVSWFGAQRFTSKYLPRVIHDNEHIYGAIFGRRKESEGFFGFVEALLVATDKRIIFIDHRPGYTAMDEINYDMVSGVTVSTAGVYSSVTLFTKIANYHMAYIRPQAARIFVDHIERRVIDSDDRHDSPMESYEVPKKALSFLKAHELGVLSSVDRTGNVAGAVVYYTMRAQTLYFMSKTTTDTSKNIIGDQHVAMTVFDSGELQTVQMQGIVRTETDDTICSEVSNELLRERMYTDGVHTPPLARMPTDAYVTFYLVPTQVKFSDYSAAV